MHSAPSVSYPVGRSRFHGALALLMALLVALTLLTWLLQADELGARHLAVVLLSLACTAVAVWNWFKAPVGVLTWDGLAWIWTDGDKALPVQPEVTLDLQIFMLLRLGTGTLGRGIWVWPERQVAAVHWLPLRRAVFGQRAAKAMPQDTTPTVVA